MSLDPSVAKTPPRPRKPIECVIYNANNDKGARKMQEGDVPFSFHVSEKSGEIKEYLSRLDEQQEVQGKSREAYTERKIKIISGTQNQKTEKKKFIKLYLTQNPRHSSEGNCDDFESLIAEEQYYGAGKGKPEEVRASLDYFTQELGAMSSEIRRSGVNLEIENEARIVMLSQMNSEIKLEDREKQQKTKRDYELTPTMKIKRKIAICSNPEQRKEPCKFNGEAYRYCIGCQLPILQPNIPKHEQECLPFQQIYAMDIEDIANLLKGMIGQLSKRVQHIKDSLTVQDLKNLKICTDSLLQQSELISLSGEANALYDYKYHSILSVSDRWVAFAQSICKLNWFIRLRQMVRKGYGE